MGRQGRATPGWPDGLGFLRHRRPAARAEVRVRVPAGQLGLGHGLARRPARWFRVSNPPPYAEITRASNRHLLLHYYDTYLGDTVQTGNLTVNVGARFDYQQGKNRPSSVPANPVFPELLPAVHYGGDSGYPITWRAVQPRVGATYAIGKDRQNAPARVLCPVRRPARARGWQPQRVSGHRSSLLLLERHERERACRTRRDRTFRASSGLRATSTRTIPALPLPINQISKSLEPPTTNEFIVGIERQISTALSASIAYTHRSLSGPLFAPLIGTTRSELPVHRQRDRDGRGRRRLRSELQRALLRADRLPRPMRRNRAPEPAGRHARPTAASSSSSSRRFPTAGCSA